VSVAQFDGNPKTESFDEKPKNASVVIPPPTITDPHDLQLEPLDLGGHEELEDEPGVDEGAPGAEELDSSDDMDEDNEILFEIPGRIRISRRKHLRMSLSLRLVKKENAVADAFLGCKILNNWSAVGFIEGEVVKRNV